MTGPPTGPDKADLIHAAAASDPLGTYLRAGYPGELKRSGHNLTGPCPFHADRDPSFAVTLEGEHAGQWKCFGCGAGGDLIAFYQRRHACGFLETLTALGDLLGLAGGTPTDRPHTSHHEHPKAPQQPPPDPEPIPESVALKCHRHLMTDGQALGWLTKAKGLPVDVIRQMAVGLSRDHWRESRFTIPIPFADGREGYRDIRGYRPAGDPKMLPWAKGRGAATVYPWPWVRGSSWFVWCEGELDALNLIGRGIPALTATCGVDGAVGDGLTLPDLTGRTVYVLGDADPAGERLILALPDKLKAAGAAAVTRLRWPATLPNGEPVPEHCDPSDVVSRCGLSDEDLWGWLGLP